MTTTAAQMHIGKMTSNELAFAKMNPSGGNYVIIVNSSGVVSVSRTSSYNASNLGTNRQFVSGPEVTLTNGTFTGSSLQQLEVKSPSKSWTSSLAFSNVNNACALVLWQPISSFGTNSMKGCPSTVYFKNAELNSIIAAASTIGLGKSSAGEDAEVTVFDMYGKSYVFGGSQPAQILGTIYYYGTTSDEETHVYERQLSSTNTHAITEQDLEIDIDPTSIISVDFNDQIDTIVGHPFTKLGIFCEAVNFKGGVNSALTSVTIDNGFAVEESSRLHAMYFASNSTNDILNALQSNALGLGLEFNPYTQTFSPHHLVCYCSDGVIVLNGMSGSSDGGGGSKPMKSTGMYVWDSIDRQPRYYSPASLPSGGIDKYNVESYVTSYDVKASIRSGVYVHPMDVFSQCYLLQSVGVEEWINQQYVSSLPFLKYQSGMYAFEPLTEIFLYNNTVADVQSWGISNIGAGVYMNEYGQPVKHYAIIYCTDGIIVVNAGTGSSGS